MIRKRYRVQKRSKKNITSSFLFKLTLTCCHFLAIFHNQSHHLLLNVENRCNRTFLYSKVSVKVVEQQSRTFKKKPITRNTIKSINNAFILEGNKINYSMGSRHFIFQQQYLIFSSSLEGGVRGNLVLLFTAEN